MVKEIVKEPNPILHRKASPVRKITEEVRRLAADMIDTMHAAKGVGLAANQIGAPLDLLIACPEGKGNEIVLFNARITNAQGKESSPEGCLSVPGVSAEVTRAARVTATGLSLDGKRIVLKADGLLAKILQHETDHLNGHLFFERLGFLKRRRLLAEYRTLSRTLSSIDVGP